MDTPGGPDPAQPFDDLILVAEFDEVSGPRPLMTFPSTVSAAFDQDAFCLRIMAVDFHSQIGTPGTSGDNTSVGGFRIIHDTQVLLSEPATNIHAYVHYFTLCDLKARGFVRPFCICFISYSADKILRYFSGLRNDILGICRILKFGNWTQFCAKLKNRERDLLFTKETLLSLGAKADKIPSEFVEENEPHDGISVEQKIEQVDRVLGDTRRIIGMVQPRLEDPKLSKMLDDEREYAQAQCAHHGGRIARQRMSSIKSLRSRTSSLKQSKGTMDLGRTTSETLASNRERTSTMSQSGVDCQECVKTTSMERRPKFFQPLRARNFDKRLKSLQQLCGLLYSVAMKRLENTLRHYCRDSVVLAMENEEAPLLRNPIHLLTIGHCVTLNFEVPLDAGSRLVTFPESQASRSIKSDSDGYEKWFDTDFFRADHDDYGARSESNRTLYHDAPDEAANSMSVASYASKDDIACDQSEGGSTVRPHASWSHQDGSNGFFPWSQVANLSSRGSLAESRGRKLPFHSSADHVAHASEHKPGYGLLSLRQRCSFIVQLVYALMRGRTVVIHAQPANEMKVRDLVTVLRLFVPGHSNREQVIAWRQSWPLRIPDLGHIKLIGLSKSIRHGIPKALRNCISILDFEKEIILTPMYNGVFLERLLLVRREIRSEAVLLAHVHSVFMEIARKAFLYFHVLCMGSGVPSGTLDGESIPKMSARKWAQRKEFLQHHGVTDSDVHIVEYLAEVVKTQHEVEYLSTFGGISPESRACVRNIRLDNTKCNRFANSRGPLLAT
eukprot:m.101197 g.101197  ORF g.101197 m.101197 type:complete len:783 (-) comp13735_c0_seq1:1363-3711(-)